MQRLIEGSLRLRVLVVPAALAALAVGVMQLGSTRLDVYPEYLPPTVQVQTEALGLSALEVEQLVTVPLEADLLNGVAFLDEIRSESVAGLSSIDMVFRPGTDVMAARQLVQERMTQAHALPNVSQPPLMLQPLSSTSRAMVIGLSTDQLSATELSVLARWKIKPRLLGAPGVANVAVFGQRERQLQVQVDPRRMAKYGVSLSQVLTTTGNALWVSPLSFVEASTPGTGGFIDTPNQRLTIQHILPIHTAGDLAKVSIESDAQPTGATGDHVTLGDVADVTEEHQPLIGDAVFGSGPDLVLVIEKFPGVSTHEVTSAVDGAMAELAPGLTGITVDASVYRPSAALESGVQALVGASLLGLLLVLLLLAGVGAWRSALVAAVSVPASLVTAVLVLDRFDATLNTMVLIGLVLAVGVVVGDVIIDTQTVRNRLRERLPDELGARSPATLTQALLEIRRPLGVAALAMAVSVAPLLLLDGVVGAFADPMLAAYLVALAASMGVALVVTPPLALLVAGGRREVGLLRSLGAGISAAVARLAGRPRRVLAVSALGLVAALVVLPLMGSATALPPLHEQQVRVTWNGHPGTSRPEMERVTEAAAAELRSIPGVRTVAGHIGRAITSDVAGNVDVGELWVGFAPDADVSRTMAAVDSALSGYPGLTHDMGSYPERQLEAARTGIRGDLAVRVVGPSPDVLLAKASEVRDAISGIPGVREARVDRPVDQPTIEVEVDLAAARLYGIKPGDVRRTAAVLLAGLQVGSLFEEQKVFDVVVWGAPETRASVTSVENLPIETLDGGRVRLGDVADVRIVAAPSVVHRESVSRFVDVVVDVDESDVGEVADQIESAVGGMTFPVEHHAVVLGESEQQAGDELVFIGSSVAAAGMVLLLLHALFGSWRVAGLAWLTVPAAASGALVVAVAGGSQLGLVSIGAVLAVAGLALRQCVLLFSRFQTLERAGVPVSVDLVARGAADRLSSSLLAPLGTALALAPLAFAPVVGADAVRQVVLIILGGLATSTVLYLLAAPALYLLAARTAPANPQE